MDIKEERGFSIDYLNECFDLIDGVWKWTASIRINKKLTHLGCFDSFESAVDARKKAEVEHYGEFANER